MRRIIYISGPITDNATGLPRDGWKHAFRMAERKLRAMGFEVINPVDISAVAVESWRSSVPEEHEPPRHFYLYKCIERLAEEIGVAHLYDLQGSTWPDVILGLYVIGDDRDIRRSYGTMCEINFALSAGLPVWSQLHRDYQIDNLLRHDTSKPTLRDVAGQLMEG